MNTERTEHCDIEDVDCVFSRECMDIYQRALSMKLKFKCPVVTVRNNKQQ